MAGAFPSTPVILYTRESSGTEASHLNQVTRLGNFVSSSPEHARLVIHSEYLEGHGKISTGGQALLKLVVLAKALSTGLIAPGTIVLVESLSRFVRRLQADRAAKAGVTSWIGLDTILNTIKQAGCHVVTLDDHHDTRGADGWTRIMEAAVKISNESKGNAELLKGRKDAKAGLAAAAGISTKKNTRHDRWTQVQHAVVHSRSWVTAAGVVKKGLTDAQIAVIIGRGAETIKGYRARVKVDGFVEEEDDDKAVEKAVEIDDEEEEEEEEE